MSRFGFPSVFTIRSAASHRRVQAAASSTGMAGATMRASSAAGLGYSVRRNPRVNINYRNNPFKVRTTAVWNPLSFGSMPTAKRSFTGVGSGIARVGQNMASRNRQVGANAIRQLINHYGKVPQEIRKDVRRILRTGGLQLARRAQWYWRTSSRAQRAIKVSTSLGWKNAGTRVWVDRDIMPFNRAWERIKGQNYYIHIPWGNYQAAAPQPNRPALRPALSDVGPRIIQDVNRQLIQTINRFQRGKV